MAERRPLLLLGAGGLAREVAAAVRSVGADTGPWLLEGMLDDDPARIGAAVDGLPVLGPLALAAQRPDALLLCCVANPADPQRRARVVGRLGLPDERYATLVHPAASLADDTRLGVGSIVLAGAVATAGVTLGRHVLVMPSGVLTHDDVVEDAATLAAGVRLAGGVRVARAAYLGAGCLVRENLTIGAGSVVGMGAVVLDDVDAGVTVVGVPARPLPGPPARPHRRLLAVTKDGRS